MKVLVFIEVDVVVRHFINSGAFDSLGQRHDVTFVFPERGHRRLGTVNPKKLKLPGNLASVESHPRRNSLWKRLYLVDQLRLRLGAQRAAVRSLHRWAMGWKAACQYTILALPGVFAIFKALTLWSLSRIPNKKMVSLVEEEKPDVVIHPCVLEGVYLNDLIEITEERGIPLVVIMNSWDNPSTKRSMIGQPDWLLVWGEQTRQHAVTFAGLSRDRVIPFGAAQFDVFKKPSLVTRSEFDNRNGLRSGLPTLLYAGSSRGNAEIEHLKTLDNAVERGVLPKMNILYRPHPWGNGGAGGEGILDAPWKNVCVESSMRGYLESVRAGNTEKYLSNYVDTHDVLSNVDGVVSPLSTIILESLLHGKPAMCFMPIEERNSHFSLDSSLVHFREMLDLEQVIVGNGVHSLVAGVVELLSKMQHPQSKIDSVDACDHFVERFDQPYAERLEQFVTRIHKGSRC